MKMNISKNSMEQNKTHMNEKNLTLDELNLFRCSEELKNTKIYSNLYDVLCRVESKRVTSMEEIYGLSDTALSILVNKKQEIKERIVNEWEASGYGYDPNQKAKCDFCHRRNNKYFFHIKNVINNTVLTVGSTCIGKFLKIKRYDEQKSLMEQDRNQRSFMMNNAELLGYSQTIQQYFDAEKYFLSLPILPPYNIYSGLKENITNMKSICLNYKNSSAEFDAEWEKYQNLKSQADTFIKDNINNPLICKKEEIDWIIANDKIKLLEEISKNNGIYTANTLEFICSEEFTKNSISKIAQRNKSHSIKFEECNPVSIVALFNMNGYYNQISFQIPLRTLMKTIGCNCILNDDYEYGTEDILPMSTIMNTQINIETIIQYIARILIGTDYAFLYDNTRDEIVIYRKNDSAVKYINAYNFLQSYSKIILQSSEKVKINMQRIINSIKSNQWISVEKQKEQGIYENIVLIYNNYKNNYS